MSEILILSQQDVKELLDLDALLDALTEEFRALSAGEVTAPPRNEVNVSKGFLLGMPAHMAGDWKRESLRIGANLCESFFGFERIAWSRTR